MSQSQQTEGQRNREETYRQYAHDSTFGKTYKTPYDKPKTHFNYSPYIQGLKYGLGLLGTYYLGNKYYASLRNQEEYVKVRDKVDQMNKYYFD